MVVAGSFNGGYCIMLWILFVLLLILWLGGFALHIAGAFIHLLLLVALVVLIISLFTSFSGRSRL